MAIRDGHLSIIMLTSSIVFLTIMIAILIIVSVQMYYDYYQTDHYFIFEDSIFYIIIFTIFLSMTLILLYIIDKQQKDMPGNEQRRTVITRSIIVAFFTASISISMMLAALTIDPEFYISLYSYTNPILIIGIFISSWALYLIFIRSQIQISKNKTVMFSIMLYAIGLSALPFGAVFEDFFRNILESPGSFDLFVGIFLWAMPFVFVSIIIGMIGFNGLYRLSNKQKGIVNELQIKQGKFFDGQISLILLTSSSVFLVAMIILLTTHTIGLYLDGYKYFSFIKYLILFDLTILCIFLAAVIFLLHKTHGILKIFKTESKNNWNIKHAFIISLVTFITLNILLAIPIQGSINSDGIFFSGLIIYIFCGILYYVSINKFGDISKDNMKSIITIFIIMILISPFVFIPLNRYFLYTWYYSEWVNFYEYSLPWVMSFVFCSLIIGYIELAGIHKIALKTHGKEMLMFSPSTDFFLAISIPFLVIPILAMESFSGLYWYYIESVTAAVSFTFIVIALLFGLFLTSRVINEKRYFKSRDAKRMFVKRLFQNKLSISLFVHYLMVVVVISLFLNSTFVPRYYKDITRKYSTPYELEVLTTCEELTYEDYWEITYFEGGHIWWAFIDHDTFVPSDWTGGFNKTLINSYSDTIDDMRENKEDAIVQFDYYGEVHPYGSYEIVYDSNKTDDNFKVIEDGEVIIKKYFFNQYSFPEDFQVPSDEMEPIPVDELQSYHLKFDDVYVVYMGLRYSEFYGPLYGHGSQGSQVIIMDDDFNIKLIITGGYEWFS